MEPTSNPFGGVAQQYQAMNGDASSAPASSTPPAALPPAANPFAGVGEQYKAMNSALPPASVDVGKAAGDAVLGLESGALETADNVANLASAAGHYAGELADTADRAYEKAFPLAKADREAIASLPKPQQDLINQTIPQPISTREYGPQPPAFRADMHGAFEKANPSTYKPVYQAGNFVGQILTPTIPGGAVAGSIPKAIGLGAAYGAAQGAGSNIGQQFGETGKVDPGQAAMAGLAGGAIGALGGGVGGAVGKIFSHEGEAKHTIANAAAQAAQTVHGEVVGGPTEEQLHGQALHEMGLPAAPGNNANNSANNYSRELETPAQQASGISTKNPKQLSGSVQTSTQEQGHSALIPQATGRNATQTAQSDPLKLPRVLATRARRMAELKAKLDYHTADLKHYEQKLWAWLEAKRFVTPKQASYTHRVVVDGKVRTATLTRKVGRENPDFAEKGQISEARNEAAPYDLPENSPEATLHLHGLLEKNYQISPLDPDGLKVNFTPVPDDVDQAMNTLYHLKKQTGTDKKYGGAQVEYDSYKGKVHQDFVDHERETKKSVPEYHFTHNFETTTPAGEKAVVRINIQKHRSAPKIEADVRAGYEAEKKKILSKNKNKKQVMTTSATFKAAKFVLTGLVVADMSNSQEADAADGAPKSQAQEDRMRNTALRLGGEIALLSALHLGVAKAMMKKGGFKGFTLPGAVWFRNNVDRLRIVDGAIGTNFVKTLQDHKRAAMMAMQGVVSNEDKRGVLLHALKTGEATSQDAFHGAGLFYGMKEAERHAYIKTNALFHNMRQHINAHIKHLDELVARHKALVANIENNQHGVGPHQIQYARSTEALRQLKKGIAQLEDAKRAAISMQQAMSPTSLHGTAAGIWAKIQSNAMNFYFTLWLPHHLVNLTDSIVMGMPEVGVKAYSRAVWDLMVRRDKQMLAALKHSNWTGGWRAVREDLGGAVNKEVHMDIGSDAFNAHLVGHAAVLQRYDYASKHLGYTGSARQYALDFYNHTLPKTIHTDATGHSLSLDLQLDCAGHVQQTLEETLGYDPLGVTKDFVKQNKIFDLVAGTFTTQPMRFARLQMKYIASGNFKSLFWMMGAMALVGGKSMMAQEDQEVMKNVDPDAYFLAAKTLNKAQVLEYLTNTDMSEKVRYGLFGAAQGSMALAAQTTNDAWSEVLNALHDSSLTISNGKIPKDVAKGGMRHGTKLTSALALAYPIVKKVPTRLVSGMATAIYESFITKEQPVYMIDEDGNSYGSTKKLRLQSAGISPVKHILDRFVLPGQNKMVSDMQAQAEEKKQTKGYKQQTRVYGHIDKTDDSIVGQAARGEFPNPVKALKPMFE
jgi:hypothetical protein